ncbi:hypothetical protein VTL71DRAFT_916 [Oculimacula yallundae]|uniref:Uncharacterized protein n=1 Tax=Oculimacula yallundae TaxID=86028 RepID=A0ABR4D1E4_9HELO
MHFPYSLLSTVAFLNAFSLVLGAPIQASPDLIIAARTNDPVASIIAIIERGIVGSGCFGGTGTGCVIKHHKRREVLLAREPEAVSEPEPEPLEKEDLVQVQVIETKRKEPVRRDDVAGYLLSFHWKGLVLV